MKSLNRLNSASELGASYGLLPNLSVNYIEEKDSVFITDKEKHFYVQSLEDGNVFSFGADTWLGQNNGHISYSKDSIDWLPLSSVESLTINAGEYIFLKSDGTNLQKSSSDDSSRLFRSSLTYNVRGNMKQLLHPNNDLQKFGYTSLFDANLVDAGELILSEMSMQGSCYARMFQNCTSLTTAPALPATTLAIGCYMYMFYGCSSLTTAPELPATTLASNCYDHMFKGCTALTTAPNLPATELASYCYHGMFQYCSNLSSINCNAIYIDTNDTFAWVEGVASSGTFTKVLGSNWTTGTNGIPSGWALQDYVPNYVTFTAEEDSTIGLAKLSTNQKLWYSKDQSTWSLMYTTTSISLASGESVYIAGLLSANNTQSNYTQFKMTGKIAASGNCNALWNHIDVNAALKDYCGYFMFRGTSLTTAPELPSTTLASWCYQYMFYGCTSLNIAPELPAITLVERCYSNMFQGCTSLTTAPLELPATTLASYCYTYMFYGCTSLTYAPELPATTLAGSCYDSMFYGCSSLTTAPELPATTLANYCYQNMFYNCTSLTVAPELPATTLATQCYQYMFQFCSALTTAPELPATTLAEYCYSNMFWGCKSLTTAPALPATTLAGYCYSSMFYGCFKLSSITCLATDISDIYCTSNWVNGVASSGTFTKAASMTSWTTGRDGIPSGWTLQDYVES